jgi:hypothetical protein
LRIEARIFGALAAGVGRQRFPAMFAIIEARPAVILAFLPSIQAGLSHARQMGRSSL